VDRVTRVRSLVSLGFLRLPGSLLRHRVSQSERSLITGTETLSWICEHTLIQIGEKKAPLGERRALFEELVRQRALATVNSKQLEWALGRAHTFAYHKIGH